METVVERRKTMGVFIPVWTAGPCRNPQCAAYVSEHTLIHAARGVTGRGATRSGRG